LIRTDTRFGLYVTKDATEIGALLRIVRKFRGSKQNDIRPQGQISQWETGKQLPGLTSLADVADKLDMDLWIEFQPRERR
jgi:transcriptional regulator with XRE-family HTH domain